MAKCFLYGTWFVLSGTGQYLRVSILAKVNHRQESRMREIRLSGSEVGGAELNVPTPIKADSIFYDMIFCYAIILVCGSRSKNESIST